MLILITTPLQIHFFRKQSVVIQKLMFDTSTCDWISM